MTQQEIRAWYEHQIEWYSREIAWRTKQIEWLTRQLERNRREDREMTEWVWSKGVMTRSDMEIWGDGKYKSDETRHNLFERKREYLRRKMATAQLKHYEELLASMTGN